MARWGEGAVVTVRSILCRVGGDHGQPQPYIGYGAVAAPLGQTVVEVVQDQQERPGVRIKDSQRRLRTG